LLALQQSNSLPLHFCHQFLLIEVGLLTVTSAIHSLQSRFYANDYFIAEVINSYLLTALHAFRNNVMKVARLKERRGKRNCNL
jgi:hypothetical protein